MTNDIRHALRFLRSQPGFTAVAVATLALGIGANTVIFSVVKSVLLSPLSYPNADRIVAVTTRWQTSGRETPRVSGGDYVDLLAAGALSDVSYYYGGEVGVQMAGRSEFTGVFWVGPDFFDVFSKSPAAGRLAPEEDRRAVVSQSFADRIFGGSAIGKTLKVENEPYEIAGVVQNFQFPQKAEIWLPARATPANLNRTAYNYRVVAKIPDEATLASVQERLDAIAARLGAEFPASNQGKFFAAVPLREYLVGQVRETLGFLMAAVSLVLLAACTNVANLLLARGSSRVREIAVRTALGASRWQIARGLLVESAALSLVGGIAGIALAYATLGPLLSLAPANLPRLDEVSIDTTVLAVSAAVSLAAGLLFGLAPCWQNSNSDPYGALRLSGMRGVLGGASNRIRSALVVAEIALAVVLAVGSGLLLRSFVELNSVDLGYRTERVLVSYAHIPASGLDEHLAAGRRVDAVIANLRSVPGVENAAAAMGLPMGRYGSNGAYEIEGSPAPAFVAQKPQAGFRLASPEYFATLGIPLLGGRDFSARDTYDAPFVAIVSQSLVRRSFAGQNPIGKRIRCGLDGPEWMTIVGVVADVRQQSPAAAQEAELYMPLAQHPFRANEVQIAVRSNIPSESLVRTVERRMRQMEPDMAIKSTTMETMLADAVSAPRFRTSLVSGFAAVALLLAMAGVYGVMAYITAQRTSEFGLRLALGSSPEGLLRLILSRALALTAAGIVFGFVLSIMLGRTAKALLFGVTPTDASTYAVVLVGVTLATLAASVVPALRAMRIDPITALREE